MSDYEKYKQVKVITPLPKKPKQPKPIPPDTRSFAVISPCFYEKDQEMEIESKNLFENDKIKFITYGKGEKFTNKVYTNLLRLYTILDNIEQQYETVLIMDSHDTLYLGGKTVLMLLSRYNLLAKKNPTVIFAAEKECYPKGSDIFYSGKERPQKYLNSGLIMGSTNLIKVMIREMIIKYDLQRFAAANDPLSHSQIYWHRYFNDGELRQNIHVDLESSFFYCLDSCDPYLELEFVNRLKIKVKKTDTYPKLFHFNRCFNKEYKLLFGEFWVNSLESTGSK